MPSHSLFCGSLRLGRLHRRLVPVLSLALITAALGCHDDAESPTAPSLATSAVAGALAFRQVDAGTSHTCAVTVDGHAWCWGAASDGQLGEGKRLSSSTKPVAVAGGLRFLEVRAGTTFSCARATDNRAYCWGANQFGQLGDGTGELFRRTPTPVAGGRRFRQLHTGYNHTCALTFDDVAFCWGQNDHGQLGDGTTTDRNTPVQVGGGLHFRQVRAGTASCGLTAEGRAYCWGLNNAGQLGDGTTSQRFTPVQVAGGHVFTSLTVGAAACGLAPDQRAWCWGENRLGQLGDGSTVQRRVRPVLVAGNHRFTGLSEGDDHGCGILTSGPTYCWGRTYYGAVGDGTALQSGIVRRVPVPVVHGTAFGPINSGASHTCALDPAGHAWCWGDNGFSALGDGTTQNRSVPVAVLAP